MTKPRSDSLTQEELKKYLSYNPETGVFIRTKTTSSNAKKGDVAGWSHHSGYLYIGLKNKVFMAHRLAWLYMMGEFPAGVLDHKNQIKNDNKWSNLRECTQGQNQLNTPKRKHNTTGYKGVVFRKISKKYQAGVKKDGRYYHAGVHDCKHKAAQAYNVKAKELYGKFACLNDIETVYDNDRKFLFE